MAVSILILAAYASLLLELVVFPIPSEASTYQLFFEGRGVPPHDHGTWAVVTGVEGVEHNISYKRLDDRSRADHAELEVKSDTLAGKGDLVCMKTGGIHEVRNETGNVTLSLHTYGKHINHTNRSQFDLETGAKKDFIVEVS